MIVEIKVEAPGGTVSVPLVLALGCRLQSSVAGLRCGC